jgi:hypothetical protein
MIKIITGVTEETEFAEDAAAELKKQIRPDVNIGINSLGILHCHPDCFDGNLLREIHRAFGFPIVGGATTGVSISGSSLVSGLSLTVLTSDEARFSAAVSGELTAENGEAEIEKLYASLTEGQPEKPAMLLSYMPFFMPLGSGRILESLGKTAPNIPVFGSVAVSLKEKFAGSYAIFNGEVLSSRIVLAAVFTDKAPAFYSVSIKRDKVLPLRAQVSAAKGQILISVGDKKYKDYMEANNLPTSGVTPFVFIRPDGTLLNRTCLQVTEEGFGFFAGEIPVNAEMSVCTMLTADNIIETSGELLERIKNEQDDMSGCLVYSCLSRLFLLGADRVKEQSLAQKFLEGKAFGFAYSGGEVCPQFIEPGRTVSLLQNTSLVVCVF